MTASNTHDFFTRTLADTDADLFKAIELELGRQRDEIELIASENIVSAAVLQAQGSVMTNKYAEGYPGASGITAAVNMWTSRKTSRSNARVNFSTAHSQTFNPIRAAKQTRAFSKHWCSQVKPFWACRWMPADT